MPFHLRNAGQTFQRFMDQVLQEHKDQVFLRLNEYGILCLGVRSLGHQVYSEGGQQGGYHSTVSTTRQFHNFYHRFVPHCANTATTKRFSGNSTSVTTTGLDRGGHHSAQVTLLSHPKSSALTCIITDASDTAVGAVLQQVINYPISFFTRKLKPPKSRYRGSS